MQFCIKNRSLCIVLLALFIASCSSVENRAEYASDIASKAGMQKQEVTTSTFILTTYYKINDKNAPVDIYIEGDGFAWATSGRLSSNPTPKDAFTLGLAVQDPASNVIYIARPCQYTSLEKDKSCAPKYWSGSRFAPEVVDSLNDAISYYTKSFAAPKINLIGYSGGGGLAALLAARRSDVVTLRTVAGNLDHAAVNKFHGVDNLDNSLNAIDVAGKLASLPQYHFAGEMDEIIPLSVINGFAEKSEKGNGCVQVSSVKGATHFSGWQENWRKLLAEPVTCKIKVIGK
jgi:dienelactone hydrolase